MGSFLRRVAVATTVVCVAVAAGACGDDDGTPIPATRSLQTTSMPISAPDGAASPQSSAPAATAYQPALVHVNGNRGSTRFDADLPQVRGGRDDVRDRFNDGMRIAFDDIISSYVATTVGDGSLLGDERSRVTTITDGVVAGVLILNTYSDGAAHPNNHVATITIDAEDARPIRLTDVFTDPAAAAAVLAQAVTRIDSRVDYVAPEVNTFLNWVPLAEGFHTYVPVAHALGDWLPVTVPWDDITDLLRPGMADRLGG
ncbi:hypothetical protein V1Y59_12310 [Gordonia sp. PKS22-38]|uniref:DUF3298 domain-containing protein n=1 Tax=Gordonia prachuapensis TaxID=3115651 RepID=A0ABU7MU56_9ACTN|nr:hypothetical protein [Gordonia sp. PKS22-38]